MPDPRITKIVHELFEQGRGLGRLGHGSEGDEVHSIGLKLQRINETLPDYLSGSPDLLLNMSREAKG